MTYDLVVIGGGVIGLAVAWRAAQRGFSTVVVDDDPERAASLVAAGMLAPVTEVEFGEEALLELNLASARLYPAFVEELEDASGSPTGYERSGTLAVARDADDGAVLDRLFRFQTELGLDVHRLRGRECRSLEPSLSSRVRSGLFVAGDHRIDGAALTAALRRASTSAGVETLARRAMAVRTSQERLRGVLLSDGTELACAQAVLSAGCWSGEVEGIPEPVRPAVRPVKGQLLELRGPVNDPARPTVRGLDVYLVPRADGRLIVGATVEEQGFDRSITAGAVMDLLRDAYELVPGVFELELVEARAGLRPGSPDNSPLVGPSGIEGLVYATGHFRNGILLAPVTADAVVGLLTGEPGESYARFSPARFLSEQEVAG